MESPRNREWLRGWASMSGEKKESESTNLITFLCRTSGNTPGKLLSVIMFLCSWNNAVSVGAQLGIHIASAMETQIGGKAIALGWLCEPQDLAWRWGWRRPPEKLVSHFPCIFLWPCVLKYLIQGTLPNGLEKNGEERLLISPKWQQTGSSVFQAHMSSFCFWNLHLFLTGLTSS